MSPQDFLNFAENYISPVCGILSGAALTVSGLNGRYVYELQCDIKRHIKDRTKMRQREVKPEESSLRFKLVSKENLDAESVILSEELEEMRRQSSAAGSDPMIRQILDDHLDEVKERAAVRSAQFDLYLKQKDEQFVLKEIKWLDDQIEQKQKITNLAWINVVAYAGFAAVGAYFAFTSMNYALDKAKHVPVVPVASHVVKDTEKPKVPQPPVVTLHRASAQPK